VSGLVGNAASDRQFPFVAVVGQADLVEALLICAVAPDVGGVLVRGERGNAKSTAVRGLAELLAPAPLVEVPLGATLDRLVGSLDVGRALAGEHAVERGLLGRADGGLLYVDEVNLLPDHLVDAMLDAAASGVVRIEREGVSGVESARFTLVGTMNVEEGELRPQLLDRFGLGVEVTTPAAPAERAEIVRRRLAFEADPAGFVRRFADEQAALAARLAAARERYPTVRLGERELLRITAACAALGIDGVRGDIVTARAARALAALAGAEEVAEAHVRRAAELALAHRRRRDPLDPQSADPEELQRALDHPPDPETDPDPVDSQPQPELESAPQESSSANDAPETGSTADSASGDQPAGGEGPSGAEGVGADAERSGPDAGGSGADGEGSRPAGERMVAPAPARLPAQATQLTTRRVGPSAGSIDTRAAAPAASGDLALVASLLRGSLREHVRAGREGVLLCLVVDASGSMGARRRAARVKGALLELLRDAYARRDRVAVIAFRDATASLLVAPGAPLERAAAALRELPTGGRTPLADGLEAAAALLTRERRREPDRPSIALVLTDGRAPDPDGRVAAAARALGRVADAVRVIDTEDGRVRLGLAGRIAVAAGGERFGFAA
jgi:magnesium chelatase subunit D